MTGSVTIRKRKPRANSNSNPNSKDRKDGGEADLPGSLHPPSPPPLRGMRSAVCERNHQDPSRRKGDLATGMVVTSDSGEGHRRDAIRRWCTHPTGSTRAGEGARGGAATFLRPSSCCPPASARPAARCGAVREKGKGREGRPGQAPAAASPHRRRWSPRPPPLPRMPRERKTQGKMRLGFGGEGGSACFALARTTDDRPIETNGSERPGHFEPRRKEGFPAQAHVAAWARGSAHARCLPVSLGRPMRCANGPRAKRSGRTAECYCWSR